MKKALKKIANELYYFDGDNKVTVSNSSDLPSGLRGDISGLTGDISGLTGDISGLTGYISGLRGDISGLTGDISGLRGDISKCELTDEERKNGVNINDLVGE
jgi:aggrecan 1